jgi:hypothetical protein
MSAVLHCEGARAQLLSSKQSAEAGTVDCGGIER